MDPSRNVTLVSFEAQTGKRSNPKRKRLAKVSAVSSPSPPRSVLTALPLSKACDACHRSKRRCDGTAPCSNCFYASKNCSYTDSAGNPVPAPRQLEQPHPERSRKRYRSGQDDPIDDLGPIIPPGPAPPDRHPVVQLDPSMTRELTNRAHLLDPSNGPPLISLAFSLLHSLSSWRAHHPQANIHRLPAT